MTNPSITAYDELARQPLTDEPYYIAAVTALADHTEVISGQDIFAENGVKLVAKGTVLGSGVRERLLNHKLLKPIDQDLLLSHGVTPQSLAQDADRMITSEPFLLHLANSSGSPLAMRRGIETLSLPPQMAFKLTVAKDERPQLFHHLLLVAVIAHYLALRLAMSVQDTARLLAAALFHDLGELHTDPALLDPTHQISDQERRYVYVHPIIGYLIARDVEGVAPDVATAILQHQERLDGSGYPYGLRAAQVGLFARIIAIADVCASVLARQGNAGQLGTVMRLNRQKYDVQLLSLLQEGLHDQAVSSAQADSGAMPRLKAVATLLERWGAFRASLADNSVSDPPQDLKFIFERMVILRSRLLEFGFDPDSLDILVDLAGADAMVAAELTAILREVHWQFADLDHEIRRNHAALAAVLSADRLGFLDGWINDLHSYLQLA